MREDGRMKAVGRYDRIDSVILIDKDGYEYPHCYILTGEFIPAEWEIQLTGSLEFNVDCDVRNRHAVLENIRSVDEVISFVNRNYITSYLIENNIVRNENDVWIEKVVGETVISKKIEPHSTFLKIKGKDNTGNDWKDKIYPKDMLIFPNLYFDWAENCRQVFEKQEEQIDPIDILRDLRSDFELMSDDDLIINREELLEKISCCLDALENEVELVDIERD